MCDVPTSHFCPRGRPFWGMHEKSHESYAKLDMGDQICVFIVEVYCVFIMLCDYIVKFALLWNME